MLVSPNQHWLFVCTANLMRSPTAEYVARKHGLLATSCGTRPRSSLSEGIVVVSVSEALIAWASIIVCMADEHVAHIKDRFPQARAKPIYCWHIPDIYKVYEPRLIEVCERHLRETLLHAEGWPHDNHWAGRK